MKTLLRLFLLFFILMNLTTTSDASVRVTQGSTQKVEWFREMLLRATYGNIMPLPGTVSIDTANGNVTLTGNPTNEFGRRFKQILDDTTNINIQLDKVIGGIGVFIGAFNGGTMSNDTGNGIQSIDVNDLRRLNDSGLAGVGAFQIYLIHELWEQYVASKYRLTFTQAHDSAMVAEAKVIESIGGNEWRRIGDVRRGRYIFFIYQRVGTNQRVAVRFDLNEGMQTDTVRNGVIDNYKTRHISSGCGTGLCGFSEGDNGVIYEPLPNTIDLSGADYLTQDAQGNIYASQPLKGVVTRLSHEGFTDITYFHNDLVEPSGLVFNDATNELFVACKTNEHIVVFNGDGSYNRTITPEGLSLPAGLDLDNEWNLFVSSHGSDSILHVAPNGQIINKFSHPDLQGPAGIVYGNGTEVLYVVSNTNNKILKFSKNGSFLGEFGAGANLSSPWGIDLDGDDFDNRFFFGTGYMPLERVAVTSVGTNGIVVFNPDGSVKDTYTEPGFQPNAMLIRKDFTFSPVSVQNISNEVPEKFSLGQNYPNPFNPSTNIKFNLKTTGIVKLAVYDITGREVAQLVNSSLTPGTYQYTFDGSGLSSGAYFYRLETDGFVETKKMLLVK